MYEKENNYPLHKSIALHPTKIFIAYYLDRYLLNKRILNIFASL